MQISYSLAEEDLVSLLEFQLERSGRLRRLARSRRILYPIGFGLLSLGTLLTMENEVMPLMFGIFALLSFFLAPPIYTCLSLRRLPKIVKERMSPSSVGARTVSASDKGLQQRVGEAYSEVPWRLVREVAETPGHVFVAIDGIYSLVIPKNEVDGELLKRFVDLVRKKIPKADA